MAVCQPLMEEVIFRVAVFSYSSQALTVATSCRAVSSSVLSAANNCQVLWGPVSGDWWLTTLVILQWAYVTRVAWFPWSCTVDSYRVAKYLCALTRHGHLSCCGWPHLPTAVATGWPYSQRCLPDMINGHELCGPDSVCSSRYMSVAIYSVEMTRSNRPMASSAVSTCMSPTASPALLI